MTKNEFLALKEKDIVNWTIDDPNKMEKTIYNWEVVSVNKDDYGENLYIWIENSLCTPLCLNMKDACQQLKLL